MTERRQGRTLGIETSARVAGAAVTDDGLLLAEAAIDVRRMKTETLLELIRRMLDDLSLTVPDLDRIAYSEGPGSFTGLRVGMAAALGLATGADLPLVAVGTLEVLAYPHRWIDRTIVTASGLRRGHLFLGAFEWDGLRFRPRLAASSGTVEEAWEAISMIGRDRFLFVGDAVDSLRTEIEARFGDRARCAPPASPRAADVAALAEDPLRPRRRGREREGRTPSYHREADARKPGARP
ncbi:MAG: tRNA (adenosine(37)-N6)-threonylcarbamoyltransferase complex dimerization subunit type 1 TsaB [Candidatus Eisenbacteria bacterium]|nr:tRNA (adenosine(37)-N6)-threonylcarbamoyltransferase complex dimerization subunit type 1 TsaB [Candidatus Latescibacterota bacterium]MBD3301569.1 tRNA (adenosine(37)-N6)-threonylcarbamoyltransferase complex dimerization subunit type 1 TsaB [Candidatus Eisenbacteria bacterium]